MRKFDFKQLFIILMIIIAINVTLPSRSTPGQDIDEFFRCDGGWCRDGRQYLIDCKQGYCTGDGSPGNFPTIINPHFDEGSWLRENDTVIGITINGISKAYPLRILTWYETVLDSIDNNPLIVSYCPLCGSGIIYSRLVINESTQSQIELTFLNSGEIYKRDLVLYDNETGSRWSQIGGEALTGSLGGTKLHLLNFQQIQWGDWNKARPDSLVMARPMYQDGQLLQSFFAESFVPKLSFSGIVINDKHIAFPLNIMEIEKLVQFTIDNKSILVAFAGNSIHFYWNNGQFFTYLEKGLIIDTNKIIYNIITGESLNSTKILLKIEQQTMYAYAWNNFYPNSSTYIGNGKFNGLVSIDGILAPTTDELSSTLSISIYIEFFLAIGIIITIRRIKK